MSGPVIIYNEQPQHLSLDVYQSEDRGQETDFYLGSMFIP
jgi:hypothetical protein